MKYSDADVILGKTVLEIRIDIEDQRRKEASAARKMLRHCRRADQLELLLVALGAANAS